MQKRSGSVTLNKRLVGGLAACVVGEDCPWTWAAPWGRSESKLRRIVRRLSIEGAIIGVITISVIVIVVRLVRLICAVVVAVVAVRSLESCCCCWYYFCYYCDHDGEESPGRVVESRTHSGSW